MYATETAAESLTDWQKWDLEWFGKRTAHFFWLLTTKLHVKTQPRDLKNRPVKLKSNPRTREFRSEFIANLTYTNRHHKPEPTRLVNFKIPATQRTRSDLHRVLPTGLLLWLKPFVSCAQSGLSVYSMQCLHRLQDLNILQNQVFLHQTISNISKICNWIFCSKHKFT